MALWTRIPPHTRFLGATTPPPPRRRQDSLLITICSSCHLGRDQLHFTDVETEAGRGLEGPAMPSHPPDFPALYLHLPSLPVSGGRRRR